MLAVFYIFYLINCALVSVFFLMEVRKASPVAVFWFGLLAFFLLPSFFDPYIGVVEGHAFSVTYRLDIFTLIVAHAYVFCVLSSFVILRLFLFRVFGRGRYGLQRYKVEYYNECQSGERGILAFLALSVFAIYQIFSQYGVGIFSGFGFVDRREGISALSGFLLSYNLIICAGIVYWFYTCGRWLLAASVVFFYLFIYLVLGGSRQPLVVVALPFVFGFLFLSKRPVLFSLLLCLGFGFIAKVLEFLLFLRNLSGWDERLDALGGFFTFLFFSEEKVASAESSLRFAFYYFVKEYSRFSEFGNFEYLSRLAFFWLPSTLDPFGVKPADFEYKMFSAFMPGYDGSMHPVFFGAIFADGGWFFLPWIVFFCFLVLFTYRVLVRLKGACFFAAWTLFAYAYMMMARGAIYGPFVVLVLGLVVLFLIQKVNFRRREKVFL